MANFNSEQFSWAEMSIAYGGRIIEGVVSVKYKSKRGKKVLRGRGAKGHGILRENYDFEGSYKIWQSVLEAMIKDALDNDVLKLQFDIIVAYAPLDGGQTVTDVLKTCEITEYEKGMEQGDGNMEIELPFIFLDVLPQQ